MLLDLTLVDQTPVVLMNKLDRVLDRDDVVGAVLVDEVDHRRERRRLAATRRPRHQDQALGQHAEFPRDVREPELLEGQQLLGDDAEGGRRSAAVHEEVAAKARETRDLVGEVGVERRLVGLPHRRDADLLEDQLHLIRRDRVALLHRHDVAVQPKLRLRAGGHVQVRGANLDHSFEQRVNPGHVFVRWFLCGGGRLVASPRGIDRNVSFLKSIRSPNDAPPLC